MRDCWTGYVAFFAIGGYAMAVFGTMWGWNFWKSSLLVCCLQRVRPDPWCSNLRLRGDYLAIVTLGFGEIVRISAQNTDAIGGPRGIAGIPHPPTLSEFEIFGIGRSGTASSTRGPTTTCWSS